MQRLDRAKLEGLLYLQQAEWPTPPTFIAAEPDDLHKLEHFYSTTQHRGRWFLRSLQTVPTRYQQGSFVVEQRTLAHLIEQKEETLWQKHVPFCLQPYIEASISGAILIRENEVLVEFSEGIGEILHGKKIPHRALFHYDHGQFQTVEAQITTDQPFTDSLWHSVMMALHNIPVRELQYPDPRIAEWVYAPPNNIYYLDYQRMPQGFLASLRPLQAEIKVIYPSYSDYPHYSYPLQEEEFPLFPFILIIDQPSLEAITLAHQYPVAGFIIRDGAWLSHLCRFAAMQGLYCAFTVRDIHRVGG